LSGHQTKKNKARLKRIRSFARRNNNNFDKWSLVHLSFGIIFGLIFSPLTALVILVAWEPIEIMLISPFLARHRITFGYETLKNSLSDIMFDSFGILISLVLLKIF
jgi:hypothetical protein